MNFITITNFVNFYLDFLFIYNYSDSIGVKIGGREAKKELTSGHDN